MERMEKQTIEEAAENGWFNTNSMSAEHKEGFEEGFIQGAKWQQERMYSEEEVYNLLEEAMKDCYASELEHHYSGDYKNLKKWFEQFKKKYL